MSSDLTEKLKSEGWVQQFNASGFRLQEAIENYRDLGFEVKTVSVKDISNDGCTACFDDKNDQTMMIFTRKSDVLPEDELFDNDN